VNAEPLFSPTDRARLDRLALRTRRTMRGEAVGERRSRRIGAGGEFADHRAYVPGDDLRTVDWNVYFRHEDLVVKRFEAVETVDVLALVDRSASMTGAKARAARRVAGAIAVVALRRRDTAAIGFLPPLRGRPRVEVHRTPRRLEALLDGLASAPTEGTADPAPEVEGAAGVIQRRGPAFLVSDFFDAAGASRGLTRLLHHGFEATAVHVVDTRDADLPVGESIRATDAETGATLDLEVTEALAEAVHAAWARRAERLRAWCGAHGVPYVRVDAAEPLWTAIEALWRAGALGDR
jgi:uncharacterized protein (DUF58 family)